MCHHLNLEMPDLLFKQGENNNNELTDDNQVFIAIIT